MKLKQSTGTGGLTNQYQYEVTSCNGGFKLIEPRKGALN